MPQNNTQHHCSNKTTSYSHCTSRTLPVTKWHADAQCLRLCNCNWGTCIASPTRRPRAHYRVNPYLGARRQNETWMFSDHDETSPSIAAVSAPLVACSMLAVQQQTATCPLHDEVATRWSAQCRSTWNIGNRCQKVSDIILFASLSWFTLHSSPLPLLFSLSLTALTLVAARTKTTSCKPAARLRHACQLHFVSKNNQQSWWVVKRLENKHKFDLFTGVCHCRTPFKSAIRVILLTSPTRLHSISAAGLVTRIIVNTESVFGLNSWSKASRLKRKIIRQLPRSWRHVSTACHLPRPHNNEGGERSTSKFDRGVEAAEVKPTTYSCDCSCYHWFWARNNADQWHGVRRERSQRKLPI